MVENTGLLVAVGYDPAIFRKLPESSVRRLRWIAAGRTFATLALSIAAFTAVLQSLPDGFWSLVWAILASVACVLILLAIQRLVVCAASGGPIRVDTKQFEIYGAVTRALLLLAVGAVAVQPLCIQIFSARVERSVENQIRNTVFLQLTRQQEALISADSALKLARARYSERLALLATTPSSATPDASPAPVAEAASAKPASKIRNHRQAIIIGAQQYENVNPLNNPIADIRDMKAKLEKMGFTVTASVDEGGDTIQSRLRKYFDSLQPGDISLIYYSGHGFQADGHNYLVPVDFEPESNANAIRISDFLDAADRHSLQLQVIILDSCRTFAGDGVHVSTGGLAELQGGNNSFIAMAAKPGEVALDGPPGSHGYFTDSILRHIDKPEDINVIFRRVSKEVAETSRASDHLQQPVITSTLTSEYVQLVAPEVAMPDAPLETMLASTTVDGIKTPSAQTGMKDITCQALAGLDKATQVKLVRSCLQSRIAAIDLTLAEWNSVGRMVLRENAANLKSTLMASGLFVEKLRTVWSTMPKSAALVTLLLAALVAIGEVLNLVFHKDSAEYSRIRNSIHAATLKAAHRRAKEAAENNLRNLRHSDISKSDALREEADWTGSFSGKAFWADKPKMASESEQEQILDWIPQSPSLG